MALPRRWYLAAVLVALIVGASGCGGDQSLLPTSQPAATTSTAAPDPEPTTTTDPPEPTTTTSPAPSTTAAETTTTRLETTTTEPMSAEPPVATWTFTGEGTPALPALAGTTAYVQDGAAVTALDLGTGEELWRTALATASPQTPVLDGGALMILGVPEPIDDAVGMRPGGITVVVALDSGTGAELWRTPVEAMVEVVQPAVDGGVLGLVGIGDVVWEDCGDLCYEEGWVFAFDTGTGQELWRIDVVAPRTIAAGDGVAVVPLDNSTLAAYDLATGESVWTVTNCTGILGGPMIAGARVAVVNLPAPVPYPPCRQAFELSTGAELWNIELADWGEGLPVLTSDTAYVGDAEGISAVDAETGEELWRIDGLVGQPVLVQGQLVVDGMDPDGNRVLAGLAPADGAGLWQLDVAGEMSAWRQRVVAGAGHIVRLDGDSLQVYAVGG